MALDPQALHSNFATGKRAASEGLTEALSSITNMDRQGYNVGDSYEDAVRGYGSSLSETFGQALSATTQQEQFDREMSLKEQQRDDQHDADTLSGISSLIGMAGSVKSLLYGGDSLMDILSGTSTVKTVGNTLSGLSTSVPVSTGATSTVATQAAAQGVEGASEIALAEHAAATSTTPTAATTQALTTEAAETAALEAELSASAKLGATSTVASAASTAAAAELAATGYGSSLAAGQSLGAAYGGGTIGAQSGAAMGAGTIAAGALGFAAVAYMAWSSYSKDEMGARNTSWLNAYYGDPHADDVSDLMEFYPDYITDEASAIEFAQAVMEEQPQFLDMLQQGVRGNTLANEPDTGYDDPEYDAPEWEEWQDFDDYRAAANIWSQDRAKWYDVLAQGVGEGSPYSDEDLEEAMKNLGRSTEFDEMS